MSGPAAGASQNWPRPAWYARILPYVVLTIVVAVGHGASLRFGWFMDDWAHVRQLREADWSLRGLTDACRLELVGGIIDLWWLPETTLRFFRPVSFALMKLCYLATGWSATAMHALSLAWHALVSGLLYFLLNRLTAGNSAEPRAAGGLTQPRGAANTPSYRGIALTPGIVALLFAIHPAHVGTVQWIACQTELMVTAFLLLATIGVAIARGWPGFGGATAGARRRAAGAALLMYAAALGCRENALLFPLVMASIEPFLSPPPQRIQRGRRRGVLGLYLLMFVVACAYLAMRSYYLGGAALPPRPYVMAPHEPDFWRFIFDKSLYYLLGEFLLAPCVPIGGLPYLQERPLLFYGAAGGLLLGLGALIWTARREPAVVLGAVWIVGFMGPVLPAFASPHHLYLPGVGWALLMERMLRGLSHGSRVAEIKSAPGRRHGLLFCAAALLTATFAGGTALSTLVFDVAQQVEDQVVREVLEPENRVANGDTLYFANLPIIAHYVRLAAEEQGDLRNLRAVGLTWSPRILGMVSPAELQAIDERTWALRIGPSERYFAGPFGRLIREAHGGPLGAIHQRQHPRGGCVIFIDEQDEHGISALRALLDPPSDGGNVHVFWGSRASWAQRVTPPRPAPTQP